jgi:hypothetical protein
MRSRFTKMLVLTVFSAGTILMTTQADSWEKGHTKIVPSVKYAQVWDSNIFYDRENPHHDWISVTTPGIMGEFGFGPEGKHKILADYKVELGAFYKYNDQNYGNHDLNTGISLDFDKYTFDTNNRWQFTSDRAGTEFSSRTLRKIDTYDAVLGLHYNKIDFDLGYRFYIVDYLSDTLKQLDYYQNEGWITGYVQVAPKTKALLEFVYQNLQYWNTGGRNANAYQILTGLKGQVTSKIEGTVKVGYGFKDYSSSSQKDFHNFVAGIDLFYDMNERVDMTLSYYRQPYESTYSNNNYYTGDHINYNLRYDLGNNFTGILDMFWFHNAYKNAGVGESNKRADNEWEVSPRLEYKWKEYIVLGGEYTFHQRESNIGSRRYDQHVIQADIRLMF